MLYTIVVLASALPPVAEVGLATSYHAWQPKPKFRRLTTNLAGMGIPKCWWRGHVKYGQPIVAHRSLPCGTPVHVTVKASGRSAWLVVGDRGPWGACVRRRDVPRGTKWRHNPWCRAHHGADWVWYKKKRPGPGIWRGVADLSMPARHLLGHNGFQTVVLRYQQSTPVGSLSPACPPARPWAPVCPRASARVTRPRSNPKRRERAV